MNLLPSASRFFAALLAAASASGATADLETKVRALLEKRCAECHNPKDEQDPVLDKSMNLAVLRGDAKVVVAGNPAASKLFELVSLDPGAKKRMPKSTGAPGSPPTKRRCSPSGFAATIRKRTAPISPRPT
jgi:Planctomycete cytochrome C